MCGIVQVADNHDSFLRLTKSGIRVAWHGHSLILPPGYSTDPDGNVELPYLDDRKKQQ